MKRTPCLFLSGLPYDASRSLKTLMPDRPHRLDQIQPMLFDSKAAIQKRLLVSQNAIEVESKKTVASKRATT
jgi:hypothetical protein